MADEERQEKIDWKTILKIIVYLLVMLLLGIILALLCLQSVVDYSHWPIYTETNVVPQNLAKFPAMTFCPYPHGYKKDVLKVRHI